MRDSAQISGFRSVRRNELPVPSFNLVIAPMTDHRPRSSYEPEQPPYTKVAARHTVRVIIGQELRAYHELPQDLPHELLTLLTRLRETEEREIGLGWRPHLSVPKAKCLLVALALLNASCGTFCHSCLVHDLVAFGGQGDMARTSNPCPIPAI